MIGPFSFGDIALIILAFVSGMLALYRGLTREILSLVAWAAAAGAAAAFFRYPPAFTADLSAKIGGPPVVAIGGVAALIFLVVLVVVHLVTMRISDAILDRQLGMVDRILGFLFGVVRAFILIVIPYMFYVSFVPKEEDQWKWVTQSMSLPYVKSTADSLRIVLLRAYERFNPEGLTPSERGGKKQGAIKPQIRIVMASGSVVDVNSGRSFPTPK